MKNACGVCIVAEEGSAMSSWMKKRVVFAEECDHYDEVELKSALNEVLQYYSDEPM